MSELKKFLDVSRAPSIPAPSKGESIRKAEFTQTSGSIEVPVDAPEGDALSFLEATGQNPDDWEVTGFRRTEWGDPDNPSVSTRFTFKKLERSSSIEQVSLDEILEWIDKREHEPAISDFSYMPGAAVLIGDNQFGKGLADPHEAIAHALNSIDAAADQLIRDGGAEEILVAWLGDHVEGFTSQGGANVWRTKLTMSEQIRATRRIMLYALDRFYPLCDRLVMAAIPGNHGEPQRFSGNGLTTYDDNHDVEALNAVADAAELSEKYPRAEFYVPEVDHLSLVVKVGGIKWGLVHGHQWRTPGKHFDWWARQTFGGMPLAGADVLLCGHYHHLLVQEEGHKFFIQTPALETESQWWAHRAGTRGNPGLVLAYTDGKEVSNVQPVRAHR